MNFYNLAGAWFAVIIPAIILMYLLKRRRQDRPVASILLWDQVLRDAAANVPWQRLRRNLLLFLQLLAAAALILAIMRPHLAGGATGGSVFMLIDTSASMQATDVAPNRLAAAVAAARRIIGGLGPRDEVTLIELGQRPRVIVSACRNRGQIDAALASLRAGSGSAALEPALDLATALAAGKRDASLVIISDGGVMPPEAGYTVPCPVRFERIGGPANNLAVEVVAARAIGGRLVGLARVRNHSPVEADYALELTVDGRPLDVRRGRLATGQSCELLWELPADARVLSARLQGSDALAIDDAGYAVVGERGPVNVLLASPGNVFIARALALTPGVNVTNLNPDAAGVAPSGYDLYVYDGALPSSLPNAPLLVLNPPAGSFGAGGELTPGEFLPPRDGESLLEFVSLADVAIAKARALTVPRWGHAVLEATATPLIYAGERNGQRVVVIGFDLHQSNLPLRPAFPILMQNIVGWLLPGRAAGARALAPGEPFVVRPAPQAESVTVTTPSGAGISVVPPYPPKPFTATDDPGLYVVRERIGGKESSSFFVVNPPPLESALAGADSLPVTATTAGDGDPLPGQRELWSVLAWLALLILAAEWWVYNRGL